MLTKTHVRIQSVTHTHTHTHTVKSSNKLGLVFEPEKINENNIKLVM